MGGYLDGTGGALGNLGASGCMTSQGWALAVQTSAMGRNQEGSSRLAA